MTYMYTLITACFFVSGISVTATTLSFIAAVAAALFSTQWKIYWRRILENKAALSFWLIGLLYIVGIFYSTSAPVHIIRDFQKQHWLWMTPILIAAITSEPWRQRMLNAFLGLVMITLLLSYFQIITRYSFPWKPSSLELPCVFMNHIVQSVVLCLGAVIVGYRLLFLPHLSNRHQILYGIAWALIAVNMFFFNEGRTGYVLFTLLTIHLCYQRFHWRGLWMAIGGGITVFVIAFYTAPAFHDRIVSAYRDVAYYPQDHAEATITPVGQRLEMVGIAQKMISERPWLGYGTGGIRTALPTVISPDAYIFNSALDYVESIYLNTLLQFGIIGLFVLFLAMLMQIAATFRLPEQYRILGQAVLIVIFVGGIANGFLISFPETHLYAIFSAVCFSALFTQKEKKR